MKNTKWLIGHVVTMEPDGGPFSAQTFEDGYDTAKEDVLQLLKQHQDIQYLDIKRKIEDLPLSTARDWVSKLNKLVGVDNNEKR